MTFANESIGQWIRMEHYRLHCVEEWPDGSYKDATLISIRSALQAAGGGLYGGRGTSAVYGVRVQEDQIGRAPNAIEINRIPRHYAAGGLGASELELQ